MSVNQHTGFPRRFVLVDFSTMAFMPNSKDRDTTVEVGPSFGMIQAELGSLKA